MACMSVCLCVCNCKDGDIYALYKDRNVDRWWLDGWASLRWHCSVLAATTMIDGDTDSGGARPAGRQRCPTPSIRLCNLSSMQPLTTVRLLFDRSIVCKPLLLVMVFVCICSSLDGSLERQGPDNRHLHCHCSPTAPTAAASLCIWKNIFILHLFYTMYIALFIDCF